MIINLQNKDDQNKYWMFRAFCDGVEIKECWYIDTELGVAQVYDFSHGDLRSVRIYGKMELRELGEPG